MSLGLNARTILAGSFGRLSVMYFATFVVVVCWPTCGSTGLSPWLPPASALLAIACEVVAVLLHPPLALRYGRVGSMLLKIGFVGVIVRACCCLALHGDFNVKW